MRVFGYSRIDTASKKIKTWRDGNQIEKVQNGFYKKLAKAI